MTNYHHIQKLGQLNSKSSKQNVVDAFKEIKSFFRNTVILPVGTYIFRARLGNSELIPTSHQELSYNPNTDYISIGRANPKGVPVFYGCSHPDFSKPNQGQAIDIAVRECSNIYRNPSRSNEIELGCVSRWRFTQPLKLFPMFNFDFGEQTSKVVKNAKMQFNENINKLSPNPARDIEINHWLSLQFAEKFAENDKHKYQITSMLSKNFMDKEHDGIIYPTVQGKGAAINIALKSDAADTLKLEYVARIAVFRKFDKVNTLFLKQSEEILNGKILSWKNCE